MSEIIQTYHTSTPHRMIPMDRDEFYEEQFIYGREGKDPVKAVDIISVFLFNQSGEIILQKRASNKVLNPNMIDKSITGHVVCGDGFDFTVMVETIQELQVPSVVVKNHDDFLKTYYLLKNYLLSTAIVEYIDTQLVVNKKITQDGDTIKILNKSHMYMGVYGGSVKNVDNEVKGVLFYEYNELCDEMKKHPDMFTHDLHQYMTMYGKEIQSKIDFLKNNK